MSILCWLNLEPVRTLIDVSAQNFYLLFLFFFSTYEFIQTFFPPALFHRLFLAQLICMHDLSTCCPPVPPPLRKKKKNHLRCGRVLIGSAPRRARPRARACEPFRPVFCACTCQREWSLCLPCGTDVGFAARKHKTRKRPKRRRCCQRLL